MYLSKKKTNSGIYSNYKNKLPKYQDVEVEAYIARTISNDIPKNIKFSIRSMSQMIAHGLKGGIDNDR